jgi:hypothetical protein
LPDANRSSVRQGVRTQGTDDDLGAAAKAGVDAKHPQEALNAKS